MKKYLLFFLVALLVLPGVVLAQDAALSRSEINRISNSVVLILALDSNGDPFASGSGTIVSPTGVIYTNRHVIEGGSDFAILTLEQLGEPAELAYFATPTMVHPAVDFAVLQIDRDADGQAINANGLNLPYIALTNTQPDIGDPIYVFGYPDIGDAHLVMTSGAITTIQNDTLNGERIPFWYQTDAQFSPGNSGGLVVNTSGRMVGIPTQVRAEERTLGRLGGVLSITAIRGALESQQSVSLPTLTPNESQSNQIVIPSDLDQALSIEITSTEHNYEHNEEIGMMIHTSATATGYKDMSMRAAVFAFWEDGSPMIANNRAPVASRTSSNQLTVQQVVTPEYDDTIWDDMWFFIPYDYLPEDGRTGTFPAYLEAQFGVDGEAFIAFSDPVVFDYTFAESQLIIDLLRIDQNVELDGQFGMQAHARIQTLNYQGEPLRVGLFVYWEDGTPIPGTNNSPDDNRTVDGSLTVQDVITPSYSDSKWEDFWFFLPYDYFPAGFTGLQDGYAIVEIGVDGAGFTSWSLPVDFTLDYGS